MWLTLMVSSALASSPVVDLLPFGVGLYVHDRPVRGVAYTLTQVAGATVLGVATDRGLAAMEAEDSQELTRWQLVGSGGAALAFGSWFGSLVDTSRIRQLEAEEAAASARAWNHQRWVGVVHD